MRETDRQTDRHRVCVRDMTYRHTEGVRERVRETDKQADGQTDR